MAPKRRVTKPTRTNNAFAATAATEDHAGPSSVHNDEVTTPAPEPTKASEDVRDAASNPDELVNDSNASEASVQATPQVRTSVASASARTSPNDPETPFRDVSTNLDEGIEHTDDDSEILTDLDDENSEYSCVSMLDGELDKVSNKLEKILAQRERLFEMAESLDE